MTSREIVVGADWRRHLRWGVVAIEVILVSSYLRFVFEDGRKDLRHLVLFYMMIMAGMLAGSQLSKAQVRSQQLTGSVFTERYWRSSLTLDLLIEPDLTIKRHPSGEVSIGYWRQGHQRSIKVLPDARGRMQEALLEVGRLLPPGRFVDERPATLEAAK